MFCRRRLLLHIRKISGGGGGTNPLQSIPGAIHLAHSSSLTAVSSAPNSELCPATVSYLISCGLSPAAAATAATTQKTRIFSTDKADDVRALLRDYGFTDADIVRTLRGASKLLIVDPERILRPKLAFFASLGFEPRKIATAPFLLARSLDKHLVPSIQFIRGIIGSDDDLVFRLVQRARQGDDARIVRGVRRRRHECSELVQPNAAADSLELSALFELVHDRDRVDGLALGVERKPCAVDLRVTVSVEVRGVEDFAHRSDRAWGEQHRPEDGLLGLEVLGRGDRSGLSELGDGCHVAGVNHCGRCVSRS
jgi:mTERF domain-containing protein